MLALRVRGTSLEAGRKGRCCKKGFLVEGSLKVVVWWFVGMGALRRDLGVNLLNSSTILHQISLKRAWLWRMRFCRELQTYAEVTRYAFGCPS